MEDVFLRDYGQDKFEAGDDQRLGDQARDN